MFEVLLKYSSSNPIIFSCARRNIHLFKIQISATFYYTVPHGRHSLQNLIPKFRNYREMPLSSFFIFELLFCLLSYFCHQIHRETWFIIFSAWLKNYVKCLNLQSLCWFFLYLNILERTFWINFWIYHGGWPVCKISFFM